MWEPQPLATLRALHGLYRANFTLPYVLFEAYSIEVDIRVTVEFYFVLPSECHWQVHFRNFNSLSKAFGELNEKKFENRWLHLPLLM
jgi:hypothetical protein